MYDFFKKHCEYSLKGKLIQISKRKCQEIVFLDIIEGFYLKYRRTNIIEDNFYSWLLSKHLIDLHQLQSSSITCKKT